ncbi:MAG: hypothetical protein ACTHMS_04055 [Jatrophihabitans sp.]|uniref:hypothetical protein n=1 Tax=Jatrophihabitans sp. TaxID=1932789 RepID=UPI003F7DA10E
MAAKKSSKSSAPVEPAAKAPKAAKVHPGKTKGGYSAAKLAERAAKRAGAIAA